MLATRWLGLILSFGLLMTVPTLAQDQASTAADNHGTADYRPWPHSFDVDGLHLVLHHPQLNSWAGNQLKGRLAVGVKTGEQVGSDGKPHDVMVYGVMWFSARTDTNKALREVTLSNITVDKVSFPTDAAHQAHYLDVLKGIVARGQQVANLDTLEASLAISREETQVKSVAVHNDPPQIIFSFNPALLVLIDGKPALKPTGVAGVSRIVNTRSLILQQDGQYYLLVASHWLQATTLDGPWTAIKAAPAGVMQAGQAAEQANLVDTLDDPSDALKQVFAAGKLPDIVVRTQPSELIMVDGDPQFEPIPGTQLAYVTNTASDVFVDQAQGNAWYVLISGRWFSAESTHGPWHYVAGKDLPDDFANIPSDSPKSAVLASIPGTPEARESLIANSIPQTAVVNSRTAELHLSYDGAPQFRPIEGTSLAYAWNTAVPVIRVSPDAYYTVQNGVWFAAASATGPWTVALDVPAVIYSIPPSSPLHYVTYVYVYGHGDDQVYVGYTPGYYGTVASDGVVVYGTGYPCDSWVGDAWYGCPATYGFGVAFGWTPWAGWSFGFDWGWEWASAWYGPWWGPWRYWGGHYPGYWGGAIARVNIYGRWGNSVVAGRNVAWADPWTGDHGHAGRGGYFNGATGGRGVGYAGRNTHADAGTTTAQAGGIRYNPQTGRVSGQAGVAGAFHAQGAGAAAGGPGYMHYDRATGEVTQRGAIDANDHVYAGKDGNVYQYDRDQGWQRVDPRGGLNRIAGPDSNDTDRDRLARSRGADGAAFEQRPVPARPQFDRGTYDNRFHGEMGGFRPSMGGGRFGGGERSAGGGGFHH